MFRPKWIYRAIGSILLITAGVLGWTLFGNREKALLAGNFHSVAHRGSGEARIVAVARGLRLLRLLDVKTYASPNLEVCLIGAHDAEDNESARNAGLLCLGAFNAKKPFATYTVPGNVDLVRYRAVAIWSADSQVNFTTAPLTE